jgi:hypothetical protein
VPPPIRDRTPPTVARLSLGGANTTGAPTGNLSFVAHSSARERSPVPSIEQAVTEKLKLLNDYQ